MLSAFFHPHSFRRAIFFLLWQVYSTPVYTLPSLFRAQQGDQDGSISATLAAKDQHGAVASESSICSQIGADILKAGGNAADSMVATTLCVGVIGMYHR
jgi:gamma-glutamyltranspeptidase / glutathione hydrolase